MTHPKGSFTLSQEQRETWFPDLTDIEIDGYLKPEEVDMNALSVVVAQKVKEKMPLTRQEHLEYFRFKSRLIADEIRKDYKKVTGEELVISKEVLS